MAATTLRRPTTPGEFRAMNEYVYGAKNKERSDGALVARLLQVGALLLDVAQKDRRDLFPLHLADMFSWYNAVANRFDLDVQEIFWQKYPGVCSYCLRPEKCMCGIEHPLEPAEKAKKLRAFRLDREGREPRTLAEDQALNCVLYSWQHERELPLFMAAYIVMEAAEVSEAFHHNDMDRVADEMADVLSRMFTFATRMKIDLAEVMWEIYPYICRKCEEERCACAEAIR